jgi:sugar/nucleoside kinase (ribokinase family)
MVEFIRCGDIAEAVRYANCAAAVSIMNEGSQTSYPDGPGVQEYITDVYRGVSR